MSEGWHVATDVMVGVLVCVIVFFVAWIMGPVSAGPEYLPFIALPVACSAAVAVDYVRQRRRKRRLAAMPANRCHNCEYDLTGNVSGVCPECGQAVPGHGASALPTGTTKEQI